MCHCILFSDKWTLFLYKGFELEITPNYFKAKCPSSCQLLSNLNLTCAFLIVILKNLCWTQTFCFVFVFPLKKDRFKQRTEWKTALLFHTLKMPSNHFVLISYRYLKFTFKIHFSNLIKVYITIYLQCFRIINLK